MHPGQNGQSLVESPSSVEQQRTIVPNSLVNCAPSFALLPPAKSKRRGRPRKSTIKSKLDIAVKGMLDKEKRKKMKREMNGQESVPNDNIKRSKNKGKKVFE